MPYNEIFAQKIREALLEKDVDFSEKKMFSGICFMVDDKMFCATHIDKKTGEDFLLCRIGEEACQQALEQDYVIPMEFTGKSMKGYIYVTGDGHKRNKDLAAWLQRCLEFNPFARASKKK